MRRRLILFIDLFTFIFFIPFFICTFAATGLVLVATFELDSYLASALRQPAPQSMTRHAYVMLPQARPVPAEVPAQPVAEAAAEPVPAEPPAEAVLAAPPQPAPANPTKPAALPSPQVEELPATTKRVEPADLAPKAETIDPPADVPVEVAPIVETKPAEPVASPAETSTKVAPPPVPTPEPTKPPPPVELPTPVPVAAQPTVTPPPQHHQPAPAASSSAPPGSDIVHQ